VAELTAPYAVLDTNLLIRLLISPHGITSRLLTALEERAYHLVTSEPLMEEFRVVLGYPRLQRFGPFSEQDIQRLTGGVRRLALVVPGRYTDLDKVPTDWKDNIVVACALEAGADFIVSDDRRDLLPLKVIRCAGFRAVQIVRPMAFLRLLGR
jgi:putative PIN family toxin of toxin-antitoxin system